MAESESWGGICVRCAELVAQVPLHITLVTVLASLAGLFVLVRCRYSSAGLDNRRLIYGSIIRSITVLRAPLARRAYSPKVLPRRKEIQNPRQRRLGHGTPVTTLLARYSDRPKETVGEPIRPVEGGSG